MTSARTTEVTFRTGLLTLAATALCAAGALPAAADGVRAPDPAGSVVVTPAKVRAGGQVSVRAAVCDGAKGVARSRAFVADVALTPVAQGALGADAAVRATAEPGPYRVTVDCQDGAGELRKDVAQASVFVVGGAPGGKERHTEPVAPVRAGGGGTAPDADGGGSGGSLTLGAAAVGLAGYVVLRRRSAARRGAAA
ncbi:hypothetical protein V1J52_08060 [Streptomyces sp. TRM 70351]|uniref:hypothetical protein n=1 Tax=Streptomyces sp. TRM 70351 TaxID=3116552 RepID=UPI002E7B4A9D|nr:hypothetical protein [Streptomyces sp. TRM 70351]MEE1928150.1 hypothetical protein [Streptomyces sp. TRM 70351]